MNQGMNQGMGQMMGQNGGNMMDSLKSNMMTMLMINNMNGKKSGESGSKDMFSMIYVFIATSVVDFLFKNAPFALNFFMRRYNDKIENIKKDLSSTTKDITDNKVKKKTASITVTINVNNPENILGQALLDFITNNKNTTHVSYLRESFILNQKDVINIDEDIFARMTQSTSTDQQGSQGSTSTNMNSGAGSGAGQSAIVQVVEIYSFTKTTDQLRNFLDEIKQKYTINVKNKLGNKRYYFNMHPMNVPMDIDKRKDLSRLPPNFAFVMKHFQTNRKFSNLFGEDIETIRNRVNFFIKNRKWYDEKGIPYTLGLLLSGSPGTGKTSTIKCLANETKRHICNVNLNNDITKTQLENLFFNENIVVLNPSSGQNETYCIPLDQRIYVLEDVDCQSDIVMERSLKNNKETDTSVDKKVLEHYEDKHKVDLSFLLNLLDGVLENPGRIVIMTSNFPDTLDSALIRPGRIDVIAKFRNCSNKTVTEMIEFFYDIQLSEEDRERINVLKEEIVTPAELSKVMFENFSDFQATIDHMEKLSEKKMAEDKFKVEEQCKNQDIEISQNIVDKEENKEELEKAFEQAMEKVNARYKEMFPGETKFSAKEDTFKQITETISVLPPTTLDPKRIERMNDDVLYVFMNTVLSTYTTPERIKKKIEPYYKSLLYTKIFTKDSYLIFAKGLAETFPLIVALEESLENVIEKHKLNKDINSQLLTQEVASLPGECGSLVTASKGNTTIYELMTTDYTEEIAKYFTKDCLEKVLDVLTKDGIILNNTEITADQQNKKIEEDTLYIFMTVALLTYTSKENIARKDKDYYKRMLGLCLFRTTPYSDLVNSLLKDYKELATIKDPLEKAMNIKYNKEPSESPEQKKLYDSLVFDGYKYFISTFFSKNIKKGHRLYDALVEDCVIEKPYLSVKDYKANNINTYEPMQSFSGSSFGSSNSSYVTYAT